MFNSAIVFDERFCLGWCDSQERTATSAANLATQAPLPVRGKVGWNDNKCQALSLAPSRSFFLFLFFFQIHLFIPPSQSAGAFPPGLEAVAPC